MVNTAGFPVMPRALVASGDKVVALVAAGMASHTRKVDLNRQVETLSAEVAALKSALESVLSSRIAPLEADVEARRRMELSAHIESLRE
jgi:predicted site-specific integrase-resolvase